MFGKKRNLQRILDEGFLNEITLALTGSNMDFIRTSSSRSVHISMKSVFYILKNGRVEIGPAVVIINYSYVWQ